MTATDTQGRTISFNSPDGSTPTEDQLNQMFAVKYGNNQTSSQVQDQTINSRPSAITSLVQNPPTMAHPVGAVLRTLQGAGELYQGVPASIALDLQRGKPQDIIGNLGKVVAGQRPAQYGDVYQGAGVPKPLAAAGGLATDIALTPGGTEGVINLAKGGVKTITGVTKNIGDFFNFDQKSLTLGDKVRAVAAQAKQIAVDQFGKAIDILAQQNPTKTVSLQDVIDGIKNNQDLPYEAKSVFNRTPILRDMLKDPSDPDYVSPSSVSLQDTQQIINYINTKIPKSIKSNSLDILDAQNDIRAAQLDAFPEMDKVRAQYGQFANDYKLIKSALNPKSTPGAISSNFSDNPAVKDAASRVLAPVIQDMQNYRNQVGTAKLIKRAIGWTAVGALTAAGGGGVVEGYKKVTGG